jgi:hypothetical protein
MSKNIEQKSPTGAFLVPDDDFVRKFRRKHPPAGRPTPETPCQPSGARIAARDWPAITLATGDPAMKPINNSLAAGLLAGLGLAALPVIVTAAPQVTMQQERAAHPDVVDAIHKLRDAVRGMEASPDDFGGKKGRGHRRCASDHSFAEQSALLAPENGRRRARARRIGLPGEALALP